MLYSSCEIPNGCWDEKDRVSVWGVGVGFGFYLRSCWFGGSFGIGFWCGYVSTLECFGSGWTIL